MQLKLDKLLIKRFMHEEMIMDSNFYHNGNNLELTELQQRKISFQKQIWY